MNQSNPFSYSGISPMLTSSRRRRRRPRLRLTDYGKQLILLALLSASVGMNVTLLYALTLAFRTGR